MIVPIPLAMVLCDMVIIDKRTEKKSLIGIFSNVMSNTYPFRASHFAVYIALTDGHGKYDSRLVCTDSDGNQIFEARGAIEFKGGAKTVVEMVYDIGGLAFPSPGIYNFSFFCGEEVVISRECTATRITQPESQGNE